jgi:hypothetical protein
MPTSNRSEAGLAPLDLLSESRQLGYLDPECSGDSPNSPPGRVATGLHMAEPRRMEVGTMSDLLLRETAIGPGLPDGLAEGNLRICARSHPATVAGCTARSP